MCGYNITQDKPIMSSNTNVFKKTGRNVTVSKNELITITIDKLMNYDSLTPKQRKNKKCPYTEPIFAKLSGGKTIQIPENIQKMAITEWKMMKEKAGDDNKYSEAHTRLGRRDRYLGQDPYVMNPDLTSTPSLTVGNEDNADYSTDNELAKLRSYERRSRGTVGGTVVPDQRYGSGGSFGDLPRDYEIFNRRISENIDDYPDENDVNERTGMHSLRRQGVRPFSPSHFMNDYGLERQERVLAANRAAVNDADNQLRAGEPLNDQGIVENCAPVEYMDDLGDDLGDNDYEDAASCKTCGPYMEMDECDDSDMMDEDSLNPYPVKEGNYRYYDDTERDVDPGYERTVTDMLERYEDDSDDSTYKYLFFILLLIVVVLFLNYKKNNGKFNFDMF